MGTLYSNEIILLSFGGFFEHALVMKYVSVWSNENDKDNELGKSNNYNQWIPFTDNQNRPIHIGGSVDYFGARAVIGGSNNHLLFITHRRCCISVFDLSTFQFIKHDTLSITDPCFHCFVLRSENGQEMMRENEKKDNEMLLFCEKAGLSIEYNEDNNTFKFYQIPVCRDIVPFYSHAYVYVNDVILFFGGNGYKN
ncbi:hypothetical protein RFI_40277, partial [Reticulomyxa filosa]